MRNIKIITIAIASLITSGCVNIMYHIPPKHVSEVYHATCFVTKNAVGVWWNDAYKKNYPIEASWMKLTWLIWVADLPCEIVLDTVTFPYDAYRASCVKKALATRKEHINTSTNNYSIQEFVSR